MKKYFIALLFGISLMSVQTVSAATLTLSNPSSGSISTAGPAALVAGSSAGHSASWTLSVSDTSTVSFALFGGSGSFLSTLKQGVTSIASSTLTSFSAILAAGDYRFRIVPDSDDQAYNFTASLVDAPPVGNVPVPAAVWLFGSALLGLVGAGRRKSQPALAA